MEKLKENLKKSKEDVMHFNEDNNEFVVNEEDIEKLDRKREDKVHRNNFLNELVKEVKKLPQHFLGKRIVNSKGKIIYSINLHGTIQSFIPDDNSSETIEIIPNEIRGSKKKIILKNILKFVCGDIGDKGYVLASSGNETNFDDYEMSDDEEVKSELTNMKLEGRNHIYRNYRIETKQTKTEDFLDSEKMESIREKNLKLLRAKKHLKSEFFRKENRKLAKIHFQSFESETGFNRILPEGEHIIDVSISDRLVHVITNTSLRSYSFSGNLFSLFSINFCPLGLISTESYVGVIYRYGLPVQGSQNLKLNLYEVYQGQLVLKTDIGISPDSELDYIGFDENGLIYIKDSVERVHVLTEEDTWVPLFQLEKDNDNLQEKVRKAQFEEGNKKFLIN
jgi:hypothetical protein